MSRECSGQSLSLWIIWNNQTIERKRCGDSVLSWAPNLQDYINIELDSQRNQLIRVRSPYILLLMFKLTVSLLLLRATSSFLFQSNEVVAIDAQIDLLLTAATFCASIISVVTGIFGMNLNNTHEDSYPAFIAVSALILRQLICSLHLDCFHILLGLLVTASAHKVHLQFLDWFMLTNGSKIVDVLSARAC